MPPKASATQWRRSTRKTARKSVLSPTESPAPNSPPPPPTSDKNPSHTPTTADTAAATTLDPPHVHTTPPLEPNPSVDESSLPPSTSNSSNFKISELPPPEQSQTLVSEFSQTDATIDEESVVKLSSPEKIEALEEQKVGQTSGAGKKKVVKKTIKVIKKIVKKKVPKSIANIKSSKNDKSEEKGRENGETETELEPCSAVSADQEGKKGDVYPMEVEKGTSLECKDTNLDSQSVVLDSKKENFDSIEVEKSTVVAEAVLGDDEMKDCEDKDGLEFPISECNDIDDNIGSPGTQNIALGQNKGDVSVVEVGEGTIAEGNNGIKVKEELEPPVLDSKETDDNIGSPGTQNVVLDSNKNDMGTIIAEGNDEMKDSEVKETTDDIGSLDPSDAVLDSEKGKRRSVKIVKKIVKKKVPKLVAKNSGKKNKESVKHSENGDTKTITDSVGDEEWTFRAPGSENVEPCEAVSAEGEDSKVEKATSVTKNILEPPILEDKDTAIIENDNGVSLETEIVLDSVKGNIDVSTSDNVDSSKDKTSSQLEEVLDSVKGNIDASTSDNVDSSKDKTSSQLEEERYSQSREEMKEAVDTNLRLNEGIVLSGEMEALERKKRRRTEIFVGGLDKETKEGDIRRIFEEVGEVVDVTLVMNRATGKNKGYAFVRYASAADAKKAIERYSKVEISGKQCGVSPVEGKDTIFLGNINRKWTTEKVIDLLKKAGIENLDKVTVMANPNNIEQNRGFAFVELETNKDAQIAFSKLQKKDVFGKHSTVKVAWAEPRIEPNEEEMLKVKSVYAEYVPSSWNEKKVRDYFGKFGDIEGITLAKDLPSSKRKDFAFVNYISRESAIACIEAFGQEPVNIAGSKVNMKVSLAKPMSKNKQPKRTTEPTQKEHREVKKIQNQPILKRHEPTKKVNYMQRYNEGHRVDRGSSTNDELLHLLRQQRSAGQIHSDLNIGPGFDHQYLLSGSKRPFSAMVDNPLRIDSGAVSRVRLESSFPTPSQSMLSHSRGPLGAPSFAYYRQQGSGHSQGPGSVYGVESFPSSFQSQERGPYGGYRSIYRRY